MCLSILPLRIRAGSSFSLKLVVKTMILSPPMADQRPSIKLRRPERVTSLFFSSIFSISFLIGSFSVSFPESDFSAFFFPSLWPIIDVVFEKISHGGYHGGFSGAGRAVEEIPTLPSFPNSGIIVLRFTKSAKIVDDFLLPFRVHSKSIKRRRMFEHHMGPHPAPETVIPAVALAVGVELAAPVLHRDRLPLVQDVLEVRAGDEIAVVLVEFKGEIALGVVSGVERDGLAVGVVLAGSPPHFDAVELVGDFLVVVHAEDECLGVLDVLRLEPLGLGGGIGGEVALDGIVRLAAVEAVAGEFVEGDVDVRVD
nr:hypothetical protein Ccrd_006329 [Ipomoea batatas]